MPTTTAPNGRHIDEARILDAEPLQGEAAALSVSTPGGDKWISHLCDGVNTALRSFTAYDNEAPSLAAGALNSSGSRRSEHMLRRLAAVLCRSERRGQRSATAPANGQSTATSSN